MIPSEIIESKNVEQFKTKKRKPRTTQNKKTKTKWIPLQALAALCLPSSLYK